MGTEKTKRTTAGLKLVKEGDGGRDGHHHKRV